MEERSEAKPGSFTCGLYSHQRLWTFQQKQSGLKPAPDGFAFTWTHFFPGRFSWAWSRRQKRERHFEFHETTIAIKLAELHVKIKSSDAQRYIFSAHLRFGLDSLCHLWEFLILKSCISFIYESQRRAVLTVLCACDLCQDAEGSRLWRPRAWVPVLRVLDQTLLTGIAERRHVVDLRLYDRFPCGPVTHTHRGTESSERCLSACQSHTNHVTRSWRDIFYLGGVFL